MSKLHLRSTDELREKSRSSAERLSGLASGRGAAVAVIILAFALRLYRLGAGSLWYDETFSAYLSGLDIVSLTRHTAGDIHPPLYYYALHFWMALAGNAEFALRFFSLLFGVLLVAAVYRIALRLFDRPVALTGALLLAVSPFHLWYSQEVRMYTMAALLVLASLWFTLAATEDKVPTRRRWWSLMAYSISAALGLYVLYYVAFALIFLNVFVIVWWLAGSRRSDKTLIGRWLLAQIGVVALYLPWLPTAIRQVVSPAVPDWRHFVDIGQVLNESWSALSLGQSSDPGEAWPFLLIIAGLYAIGLFAVRERWGRLHVMLLAGEVWGPVLLIFLVSLITPLFFVRYVFIYSPLFYVALALGVVCVARFSLALGLLNLLVVLGTFATSAQAYFHSDPYAPDDFRSAVRYLQQGWGPGDAVLLDAGYTYPAFLYYYRDELGWRGRLSDYSQIPKPNTDLPVVLQTGSVDGDARLGWTSPQADFYPTTRDEVAKALQLVAERHRRLWLLRCYDTVTDPQGFVRAWLAENATLTDDLVVQGSSNMRVQRYLLGTGRGAKPAGQPAVNFDNAIAIASFETSSPSVRSGETVFLRFEWLRQGEFAKDVRTYVALVDERGRIWQQQDNVPVGRLYPSSRWPAAATFPDIWQFRIPPGTPPGTYKLVAGTYVASGGQILEVQSVDRKPMGPQAILGSLTVEANPAIVPPPSLSKVAADFGRGLGLVDYKLGSQRIKPGEFLPVDLFWRALSAPGADYVPGLSLRDRSGTTVSRQEGPPVDGRYPTARWQKGEVVRDQREMAVDAGVPDGDFGLYVSLDGKDFRLGTIKVRGRPHSYEVPNGIGNRVSVRFGDGIELLGFDVEPRGGRTDILAEVESGQKTRVVLYWKATKRTETSYTVFTQILDGANRIQGQRDRPPGDGALPTTSWLEGEVIVDAFEVQIKPGANPGEHLLIVGMYDPKTGQRLAQSDPEGHPVGDAFVLGKINLKSLLGP